MLHICCIYVPVSISNGDLIVKIDIMIYKSLNDVEYLH